MPSRGCPWPWPSAAVGAGRWSLRGDWPGRWDRAILELRHLVQRFVLDACRQCVRLGVHFPYEPDAGADADLLAIRLYQPLSPLQTQQGSDLLLTCTDSATEIATTGAGPTERLPPGAKAVYAYPDDHARTGQVRRSGGPSQPLAIPAAATLRVTAMDWATQLAMSAPEGETTVKLADGDAVRLPDAASLTVWECTCGHRRCAERHRLSAWDPALSLTNFVASAIRARGTAPNRDLHAGHALCAVGAGGILMARLRTASVEFRRCPSCGAEYGGRRCPQCKTPASPTTERLLKQLLIVDDHEIPLFVRQERWRCRRCGHLYEPPTAATLIAAARTNCSCGAPRSSPLERERPLMETGTVLERARQFAAHLKREPAVPGASNRGRSPAGARSVKAHSSRRPTPFPSEPPGFTCRRARLRCR